MNELSKAAAIMGRKGGKAGKGTAKFRDTCRVAALKRWGPPDIRFWKRVDKRGDDECWPWKSAKPGCYGLFGLGRTKVTAHRYAYCITFGEVPKELDVCHKCDNPPCCNPKHLFSGTTQENVLDAVKKGRWNAPRGERSGKSVFTEHQVRKIRELHKNGVSQAQMMRDFRVSEGAIAGVVHRRTWKHI